jgi:hypothetical protein
MVPLRDHVLMVLGGASREGNVALTEVIEPGATTPANSTSQERR